MSDRTAPLALALERDIVSLFHWTAADVSGDLEPRQWLELYPLPYWEYLDLPDISEARRSFIRQGCLLLMLRFALESYGKEGELLRSKLPACDAALTQLEPTEDRERELVYLTQWVVRGALQGVSVPESIRDQIAGIEREVLLSYFAGMGRRVRGRGEGDEAAGLELMARYERQAEEAYRAMYDANNATETAALYNECKESMAAAIAAAREMNLNAKVQALEVTLQHYRSVFRNQFS